MNYNQEWINRPLYRYFIVSNNNSDKVCVNTNIILVPTTHHTHTHTHTHTHKHIMKLWMREAVVWQKKVTSLNLYRKKLTWITLKYSSACTCNRYTIASSIEINHLILYRKIITLCSEIHSKHTNILFGHHVECFNIKLDGIQSNHWALNG